jgi:DNA-binding MarR family transcriptional regulator
VPPARRKSNRDALAAPAAAATNGDIGKGMLPRLIGYHLRRAQVAVFQNFAEAMTGLDVTPGQFGVLEVIAVNPGLSQTTLARAIGIDRSTMVAVIDGLEARGLVVRAPAAGDRRSYALRLSRAGADALARMRQRVRRHEAYIARDLSAEESRLLIDLLQRLARKG